MKYHSCGTASSAFAIRFSPARGLASAEFTRGRATAAEASHQIPGRDCSSLSSPRSPRAPPSTHQMTAIVPGGRLARAKSPQILRLKPHARTVANAAAPLPLRPTNRRRRADFTFVVHIVAVPLLPHCWLSALSSHWGELSPQSTGSTQSNFGPPPTNLKPPFSQERDTITMSASLRATSVLVLSPPVSSRDQLKCNSYRWLSCLALPKSSQHFPCLMTPPKIS